MARPHRRLECSQSREMRPKIANDPLEDLCFFRTGQRRQKLLNFLQRMHDFVSVPRLQVAVVEQVYHPFHLLGG